LRSSRGRTLKKRALFPRLRNFQFGPWEKHGGSNETSVFNEIREQGSKKAQGKKKNVTLTDGGVEKGWAKK